MRIFLHIMLIRNDCDTFYFSTFFMLIFYIYMCINISLFYSIFITMLKLILCLYYILFICRTIKLYEFGFGLLHLFI